MLRAAGIALAAVLLMAAPVRAQTQTGTQPGDQSGSENRCLLLGPLAISSYIAMLEQISRGNRAEGARQAENAANVMALYTRLKCPENALVTAIECLSGHVVSPTEKKPIGTIAQQCMKQSGMPTR